MKGLTHKDYKEFKDISTKQWHDEEWHRYMNSFTAECFNYAESNKEPDDTVDDIIKRAEDYGAFRVSQVSK